MKERKLRQQEWLCSSQHFLFGVDRRASHRFTRLLQHIPHRPAIPQGGLALDDIRILHSNIQSGFAQFADFDAVTQGVWQGIYGADGYLIVEKEPMLPEEVKLFWDTASKSRIWEDSSSDVRGLQFSPGTTILSARYADAEDHPWWFSVDVGRQETNVSLYFLDGDSLGRSFILNVTDHATGARYDVRTRDSST